MLFVMTATLLIDGDSNIADPTRMPSMIVSGIGFIGAGAILRSRISVSGLASAATIWSLGGLGILIGSGHILIGVLFALAIYLLLSVIPMMEHFLFNQQFCMHMMIVVEGSHLGNLRAFLSRNQINLTEHQVSVKDGRGTVSLDECGIEHKGELLESLRLVDGVIDIQLLSKT